MLPLADILDDHIAFVARWFAQDPRVVAEWKQSQIIRWYNAGMDQYNEEMDLYMKAGACPWRRK